MLRRSCTYIFLTCFIFLLPLHHCLTKISKIHDFVTADVIDTIAQTEREGTKEIKDLLRGSLLGALENGMQFSLDLKWNL